jgi:C4-type Zn-finger protein
MASVSSVQRETCPHCGSTLVNLDWDERVNGSEIQDLWHCWNCNNEFITVVASDRKPPEVAEITRPFFTSLLIE